uniref:NADH-ubiquinone oxidoreductase chain 6 n=1 Tax=Pachyta bicuneata TaxID=351051 RepID=A0A343ESQ0_9CUCU|nr:NADH dehydrogenase subunit 6 [Pachyta bicuneata]
MMFFLMFIILFSVMFLFLNHPLSFGLILLMQTIMITLITGMMNFNYWFSYILFLIMIGGMLILFIYMTSIASNEKVKFSYKIFFMMMSIMFLMLTMIFIDFFFLSTNLNSHDLMNQNFNYNNNYSFEKFMNHPSNLIIYLMIIYLLMTLIAVVKITKIKSGPLRQKN